MSFHLNTIFSTLQSTPTIFHALLDHLPTSWVHQNEGGETWSPYDIVGHMVHGEKTDWIPRAQIILSDRADKTFTPFDRFAQERESVGKTLDQLIKEFAQLRKASLNTLRSFDLSEENLKREGIHPAFGAVTLQQLLATWSVHDLSHIHQLTRVIAKNQKEETGPWVDYLSFLHR
ncbi:MAG: DinB family protein [Bacteroidota bacterium]